MQLNGEVDELEDVRAREGSVNVGRGWVMSAQGLGRTGDEKDWKVTDKMA